MKFLFFKNRIKLGKDVNETQNTVVIGNNYFTANLEKEEYIETIGIRKFFNIHPSLICNITDERIKAVKRLLKINTIHNAILCVDALDQINFSKLNLIAEKNMIRLYIVPDIKGLDFNLSKLISIGGIPMIKSISEPLQKIENRIIKRLFDILFSLLVLIFILSWLYPLIALIIRSENPGPVIFKQKRSGYLNHEFYCLKFRTMKINSESDLKTATKEDSRVTRFGAILRKTSLDELPQFINVLRGEMSVVGPRPHMLSQTQKYSDFVQKYMIRHFVKPGITGWAQVMGNRGEIKTDRDMEKRVEKDIWYIHNWSLFLDLKIIFKTVLNIIKGDKQAY